MLRIALSTLVLAAAFVDAAWSQDNRIFCDVARPRVPAGSTSCTAYMDTEKAGDLNVIVTDLQGTSQVLLFRKNLPSDGSCGAVGGVCVPVTSDAAIAFADACSGDRVPMNCPGIALFWLRDSRAGLTARTPKAQALVAVAKDLRAGDQEVIITGQAVAIVSKASAEDERLVRISRAGRQSRSMPIPKASVTLGNLRSSLSTLNAAGFFLEELVVFGDAGDVVVERNGFEFFLKASCAAGCGPKLLLSLPEFEREYTRRFAIAEIERTATPDFEELRRLLRSALVTPGFRVAERQRAGLLQMPGLYLVK